MNLAQELLARIHVNPHDSAAWSALRHQYERSGNTVAVAELLERWATYVEDPAASAHMLFEAGELAAGPLRQSDWAMRLYEKALELNLAHFDASMRLEELYRAQRDLRKVATLLEKRIDALSQMHASPVHIATAHFQLGTIFEKDMGHPDRAIDHYRRAFEVDPTMVAAIYAARILYIQAGNLRAAATLYELEANAEADPPRKIALFRELCQLRVERLGDLSGGIAALHYAVSYTPHDFTLMHELATLLLRRAEQSPHAETAQRDRTSAADLMVQIAGAYGPEQATPYLESALSMAPDHEGALSLYEQWAERNQRHDLLVARWITFIQAAPVGAKSRQVRLKLAEIYRKASQVEDAIATLEPLLPIGDHQAAHMLAELYAQLGRHDQAQRALQVSQQNLSPHERVERLREIGHTQALRGDKAGALTRAREILSLEPADPESLSIVEEVFTASGDFSALRELWLGAARAPGVSGDVRKHRLRAVANLSETKLGDREGAIAAWRTVLSVDPTDLEAHQALKKLLAEAQRWDELIQVMERQTLMTTDAGVRARVFFELAEIHRKHRGDLPAAIECYRHVLELQPEDSAALQGVSESLLEAGAYLEALPWLRHRLVREKGPDRVRLLHLIAQISEEYLQDYRGAYEACTELISINSNDAEALDRMERIDTRLGRTEQLAQILQYRLQTAQAEERVGVLVRLGQLIGYTLGNVPAAAEYFAQAFAEAQDVRPILLDLCRAYEAIERPHDLLKLLRVRVEREKDAAVRAEIYRSVGRLLTTHAGDLDAVAEAWEEVLAAGDDREALIALRDHAQRKDQPAQLQELLGRLLPFATTLEEQRDWMVERAKLLADRLDRKDEAIVILRDVVANVDTAHVPSLVRLAALCEAKGDLSGLADALERQLAMTNDTGLRLPVAQRLADLYHQGLEDLPNAVRMLRTWSELDETDPEPLRRLLVVYELNREWPEVLQCLDGLAELEEDPEIVASMAIRAALVAARNLGDVEEGWSRLTTLVQSGLTAAQPALAALSAETQRQGELADFYEQLAKAEDSRELQKHWWTEAARVYEELLQDPARALEALLRAFAVDLADETYLDEIDRLAAGAGAWARLAQVYQKLVDEAVHPHHKADLLLRYAERADQPEHDPNAALDALLRACVLAPTYTTVFRRAEELALRVGRIEDVLGTYEKLRNEDIENKVRVQTLLDSAKLCVSQLDDSDRALLYLAQAVAIAAQEPEILDMIEVQMQQFDAQNADSTNARELLIDVYDRVAQGATDEPDVGASLLGRASSLLLNDMADVPRAWQAARQAALLAPANQANLNRLAEMAEKADMLEELELVFQELTTKTLDKESTAELLRRRAHILVDVMHEPSKAADVYAQLVQIQPQDRVAASHLRQSLRQAKRYSDLLVELHKALDRSDGQEQRVALLREVAIVWETLLQNRWEAMEAWKKVLAEDPEDRQAKETLERLERAQPSAEKEDVLESEPE